MSSARGSLRADSPNLRGLEGKSRRKGLSEKTKSNLPIWIFLIAIAVVVVVILILVIWLAARSHPAECKTDTDCPDNYGCDAGKCIPVPQCQAPPSAPTNPAIQYDADNKTAMVSWDAVPGATGYTVYRKLGDNTVGRNNYDEIKLTTNTSEVYANLPDGLNWFVITSRNACGESIESTPPLRSAACDVIPMQPNLSIVSQDTTCGNPSMTPPLTGQYELVEFQVADPGLNIGQIYYGTGWAYGDGKHFQLTPDFSSPGEAALKCNSTASVYAVNIKDYFLPNILDGTDLGSGLWEIELEPNGAEELAWFVPVYLYENAMAAEPYGVQLLGGTVTGPRTKLQFQIPAFAQIIDVIVAGYLLCNKSEPTLVQYNVVTPPMI